MTQRLTEQLLPPGEERAFGGSSPNEVMQAALEDLQDLGLTDEVASYAWTVTDAGQELIQQGGPLRTARRKPTPTGTQARVLRALNKLSEQPESDYAWTAPVNRGDIFQRSGFPDTEKKQFGRLLMKLGQHRYLRGKTDASATCRSLLWEQGLVGTSEQPS